MSLHSEFRVVVSLTISAYKRCSVRLYLQLFVRELMSYLRYLCLFAYSGVQHILCCVFACLRLGYTMLLVSLDCPYLIAPSVFSNDYLNIEDFGITSQMTVCRNHEEGRFGSIELA